jgi:hypothetical protein
MTHAFAGKCTRAFTKDDLSLAASSRKVPRIFKGRPILRFLGAKIAHFLHDYHHEKIGHGVLAAPNGQHNQLSSQEISHFLHRIQHARAFGLLKIIKILKLGHKDFSGSQYVRGCQPEKKTTAKFGGSASGTDFVFFIPPPPFYSGDRRDFKAGLDSCWYGRVVLLFQFKVDADNDDELDCSCAMIELFFDYRPLPLHRPLEWARFGQGGTKMVYLPAPDSWHRGEGGAAPVVYIVPVEAILGRLPLTPAGEHGTIPYTETQQFRQRDYPQGKCDEKDTPGTGS